MSDNTTASVDVDVTIEGVLLLPYKVGWWIHLYYMPVMLSAGAVGNVLSFLVMIQKHNRLISCCVYITYLAVTDLCMLIVSFCFWITSGVATYARPWECKFIAWFFMLFNMCGVYLVVAMTMDRYFAICFPLKFHFTRQPRFAHKASIAICLFCTCYTAAYLWTANLIGGKTCSAVAETDRFSQVYSLTNTCLGSVVPFTILITLNARIAVAVRDRTRKVVPQTVALGENSAPSGSGAETKTASMSKTERQLIAMLFMVSCALLLLTSPQYVRYIVASTVDYKSSPQAYANFMLLYHVSNKLYITNHAVNFFLYVLGGSRFRRDVRRLVCGKKKEVTEEKTSGTDQTQNTAA